MSGMADERAMGIEEMEKRLAECEGAPHGSLLFLLLLASLGAIVYYLVDGMSDTTLLISGLVGIAFGGPTWLRTRAVHKHLAQLYEEALAAKRRE